MTKDEAAAIAMQWPEPEYRADIYFAMLRFDPAKTIDPESIRIWPIRAVKNAKINEWRRRRRLKRRASKGRVALHANVAEHIPRDMVEIRDELHAAMRDCPPAIQAALRVLAHAEKQSEACRLLGYRHRNALARRLSEHRANRQPRPTATGASKEAKRENTGTSERAPIP